MAAPKVESSNTRFFVLLALGAIAIAAWYALRGSVPSMLEVSLPAFDPMWLIIPLVLGTMVFKAIRIASDQVPDDSEEALVLEHEEPSYRSEEEPIVIDKATRWEDLPPRERAQTMSIGAILISLFVPVLGPVIALVMLRTYQHEDSTLVTVARVIAIGSLLLFTLPFLIPLVIFLVYAM